MSYLDDRRLLVKIANMYYEEGVKQSEIAKKIGVSRSLISKYLTRARKEGIVEIIIHDNDLRSFTTIERKLEKKYGLREVVCVESPDSKNSKSPLAAKASEYLLRMIRNHQVIGVTSGTTLNEVANTMSSTQFFPDTCFVPLVGGMGDEKVDIHSNSIIAKLAEKLQAKYHFLHAPVLMDSEEARDIMMNQVSIRKIFELGMKADIALVGIGGSPEHSTMVKSYKDYSIVDDLNEEEIAGDICYNFINDEGKLIENEWNKKTISADINKLKEIPLVIAVAAGEEKVRAIKAALRGELVHVLITDEVTAKRLLND
ncbi:sugar-binding transcriptional regulator [Oceanobacillus sp. J11TS1]|uniref:sugar-binding transcriptional regulator n=1 Tax=Oceanobacillus sp. J11TS1 TaxID=2807191 RepID=UPI001B135F57|nr:sugar-binding transcriptional regulator [Oceanobacillus sp. J11TS1]GIO21513.1 DeoR family transcriptional regulator [Oceanobacillus sp. J11TS1]